MNDVLTLYTAAVCIKKEIGEHKRTCAPRTNKNKIFIQKG